ncbi:MAG TPA: kelch repeat-containing protein [Nitrososphaera sp.]|nr:kelch repeat-containing protein [Nitrososphaera sp.]
MKSVLALLSAGLLILAIIPAVIQTDSTPGHLYSSGNWQSLSATPGAIRSTAIAYSPDDHKILLYGGRTPTGGFFNQVWVYDLAEGTWTQKTGWNCVPSCPAGRSVHSMVYDDFNNKFVIFGGYLVGAHSFETNETWTYDLATNTWKKLNFGTQALPEKRHWGSLEYNPNQRVSYMFGGHFNNAGCPGDKMYNDVWKLDISGSTPKWTNMNPLADDTYGKPAPRQSDWVYNSLGKVFYVFGGKQELGPLSCGAEDTRETHYNDIWKYEPVANKWALVQSGRTDYTHYPDERRTDIVYDDAANRMILFSGLKDSESIYAPDTWMYDFDNEKWSTVQDADGVLPPSRMQMAAAWDSTSNAMYLYGVSEESGASSFWKLKVAKNNISVNCFNRQPVIFGTSGNDPSILGNDSVNVIFGLTGDDNLRGDLAGDFLCGAGGNDKIYGDAGNDMLFGFDGNDEIYGGSGDDILRGGAGNDLLIGEAGKDKFECGAGIDTIAGFKSAEGDTKTADCEIF